MVQKNITYIITQFLKSYMQDKNEDVFCDCQFVKRSNDSIFHG